MTKRVEYGMWHESRERAETGMRALLSAFPDAEWVDGPRLVSPAGLTDPCAWYAATPEPLDVARLYELREQL